MSIGEELLGGVEMGDSEGEDRVIIDGSVDTFETGEEGSDEEQERSNDDCVVMMVEHDRQLGMCDMPEKL
jgi:hypothetical protein